MKTLTVALKKYEKLTLKLFIKNINKDYMQNY